MSTTLQLGDELAPLRIDPVSRATLELEVVLADGTRTLLGEAVVALD